MAQITWTRLALADLEHARIYIAEQNPYASVAFIERIEQALEALTLYPQMGRMGRCKGTRELVITGTPFIIPYRMKKNTIEILAVIHHAHAWPEDM
jgi:addiction module RelE/StbE family toxin